MESVSVFNGEALRLFSFGTFVLSIFLNIGLIVIFAPAPLSAAVSLYAFWGLILTGGAFLAMFRLRWVGPVLQAIDHKTDQARDGCKGKRLQRQNEPHLTCFDRFTVLCGPCYADHHHRSTCYRCLQFSCC
jgi:hypothetical protein